MHDITEWLNGPRDYNKGLALLQKHGASAVLLSVLGAGDTFYNRIRLVKELTKLAPRPVVTQATQPAGTKVKPPQKAKDTPKSYGRKAKSYYPVALHQAFERQDELYRQVNHLHPQLEVLHELDQGKCTTACKAIVKAWQEINAIYRLLDYWDENKVILPHKYQKQEVPVLTDRAAIMKRIQALRVYISRNKNNVARDADVVAWKNEMEELKLRIESE